MVDQVRPFLMFEGRAEEAMNLYVSLFADAEILLLVRYGPNQAGKEGTVLKGVFRLAGQQVLCTDSNVAHGFTFTPSMSMFVDCQSYDEIARLAAGLGEGGGVLMELGDYGFSRQFTWLNDRFGVSWQLNLP
jgi:predicted 3-demethylubiquinone-9 3-methyltransferase (glyoxalase superfamily)